LEAAAADEPAYGREVELSGTFGPFQVNSRKPV
jgi:hypothetical protein